MKKRDFLKKAGVGTAATVAATAVNAPYVLAQSKTPIKWRLQTYAGGPLAEHVIKPAIDSFNTVANGEMGPAPKDPNARFEWSDLFSGFKPEPHPFEVARALLHPRWSRRAVIHYDQDILFFKDIRRKARVLLFNIGMRIYAYHPKHGVWRTKATLPMLRSGQGSNMITYPGGVQPVRVQILPWDD